MSKAKKSTIEVKGMAIGIVSEKESDYICLTDIARYRDAERTDYLIQNWLRNRNTIEFLGIWEQLNNSRWRPWRAKRRPLVPDRLRRLPFRSWER